MWACEESEWRTNLLCWTWTGQVLKYDLRNTSRALKSFSLGRRQPIHSIRECNRGLFVGKVGGVEFWKRDQDGEYHMFEENECYVVVALLWIWSPSNNSTNRSCSNAWWECSMFSLSRYVVFERAYYLSDALTSLSNTGTDRFQIKQSSAVITVDVFCLVQFCLKWTTRTYAHWHVMRVQIVLWRGIFHHC